MSKALKKKLIAVFNKYIRLRDGNTCVVCGSKLNPNCGHFLSCIANSTRFDERNCNCQCATCNKSHEYDPVPYARWMDKRYGKDAVDELSRLRHTTKKIRDREYEEMIEKYKQKIKELETVHN